MLYPSFYLPPRARQRERERKRERERWEASRVHEPHPSSLQSTLPIPIPYPPSLQTPKKPLYHTLHSTRHLNHTSEPNCPRRERKKTCLSRICKFTYRHTYIHTYMYINTTSPPPTSNHNTKYLRMYTQVYHKITRPMAEGERRETYIP